MTTVYKILAAGAWKRAEEIGTFGGSAIDERDGFIHLSTGSQVRQTAALHFRDQSNLLLVAVDAEQLGDALKYEISRGGDRFPHLYGPLPTSAALWVTSLPLDAAGDLIFPERLD